MSLQSRLTALITAIGADIKALQARMPGYFGDGSDGAWTAQVTPTNVIANPDAAANTTGWNPFTGAGGAVGAVGRVADAGFTSGFAFEDVLTGATGVGAHIIYPGSTASFVGSAQNVVPNQVVDFTGQVKAQAGAYSSIKIAARWLKADGSLISEVDIAVQNAPVVGTVYSLSGSLIAPANAAYAGIEVIAMTSAAGNYTLRTSGLNSRPLMPGTTRSGAVYTLTRDVYFTDLTVNTGVSIVTHGYRVFCRGTLSGAGTISADGQPSTSRSAGARALAGAIEGGYSGGDGGVQNAVGAAAALAARGHGGIGGAGGAGTGFAGGAQPTTPTLPDGGLRRDLLSLLSPFWWNFTAVAFQAIAGGGGGSGGGGSSTGAGGGGGGGGGVVVVAARTLSGTIAFTAKGGAGGAANPTGGTNAGGGGGGAGGAIHLIYGSKSGWTGTTDVTGGAAGAGNGTGAAGTAGGSGNVIQLAAL